MKRVAIALGLLTGVMVLTGGIAIAVAPRDAKSTSAKPKPAPVKLDDVRSKETLAIDAKQTSAPVEPVDPFAKHASPIATSSQAMERLSIVTSAQAPMGEPTPATPDDGKTAPADAQADGASTVTSADDIPPADPKAPVAVPPAKPAPVASATATGTSSTGTTSTGTAAPAAATPTTAAQSTAASSTADKLPSRYEQTKSPAVAKDTVPPSDAVHLLATADKSKLAPTDAASAPVDRYGKPSALPGNEASFRSSGSRAIAAGREPRHIEPAPIDAPRKAAEPTRTAAERVRAADALPDMEDSAPPAARVPANPSNVVVSSAGLRARSSAGLPGAAADLSANADTGLAAIGPAGSGRPGNLELEGPQPPTVSLEKRAPAEIQVGKPAVFEVRVRNTGKIAVHDVTVHDIVPQGTKLLKTVPAAKPGAEGEVLWSLGTLKAGEEVKVQMEVMPTTEGEVGSVATVYFAAAASTRTVCTRPQLSVKVEAPQQVLIGQDWTAKLRITNNGTGAATGVVLQENVPENLQHEAGAELEYEVGILQPNETRELALTMKAVKPGKAMNQIVALGDAQLRVQDEAQVEVVAPQVRVEVQGPKRRFLERQATQTITLTNSGTAPAKNLELTAVLPKGLKFVEANNQGQYDAKTGAVHWLLEELGPGQTGSVALATLPMESGDQVMRISTTATPNVAIEQEELARVEGLSAILFEVVDVADPIATGSETTYEIRVMNQGSKSATGVQLSAMLPPQLKPIDGEGPTHCRVSGSQIDFEPIAKLAPKADTTFRVRAQAIAAGDARVRVQITTDELKTPVTKEESTRIYSEE